MESPASTMPYPSQEAIRTLESRAASGKELSSDRRYAVVVLEGKERGKVYPIAKSRVTVGRTQCDINLEDSDISRQHVLLQVQETGALLEDLGSTNGTFVGTERVQRADLEDRSEFRIGNHQLMFVVADRDSEIEV
jgi:pSer/pThr/pTyr-binding forkhead associated (FHA) protein